MGKEGDREQGEEVQRCVGVSNRLIRINRFDLLATVRQWVKPVDSEIPSPVGWENLFRVMN